MTISQTNSQMIPKISPQIQQELKDIQGEKAKTYSNRIFNKLPETASVTLQRIKTAILGKNFSDSWLQLSKNPQDVIKENKAFFAAGALTLGGAFISLLPKSVQDMHTDKSDGVIENEIPNRSAQANSASAIDIEQGSILPSLMFAGGVLTVGFAGVLALRNYCSSKKSKLGGNNTGHLQINNRRQITTIASDSGHQQDRPINKERAKDENSTIASDRDRQQNSPANEKRDQAETIETDNHNKEEVSPTESNNTVSNERPIIKEIPKGTWAFGVYHLSPTENTITNNVSINEANHTSPDSDFFHIKEQDRYDLLNIFCFLGIPGEEKFLTKMQIQQAKELAKLTLNDSASIARESNTLAQPTTKQSILDSSSQDTPQYTSDAYSLDITGTATQKLRALSVHSDMDMDFVYSRFLEQNTNNLDKRIKSLDECLMKNMPYLSWSERLNSIKIALKHLCEIDNLNTAEIFGAQEEAYSNSLTPNNYAVISKKNPQLLAVVTEKFITCCNFFNINPKNRNAIIQQLSEICQQQPLEVEFLKAQLHELTGDGFEPFVQLLTWLKKIRESQTKKMNSFDWATNLASMFFPISEPQFTLSNLESEVRIVETLIDHAENLHQNRVTKCDDEFVDDFLAYNTTVATKSLSPENSQVNSLEENLNLLSPPREKFVRSNLTLRVSPGKTPPKSPLILSPQSILSPRALEKMDTNHVTELLKLKQKYKNTVTHKDIVNRKFLKSCQSNKETLESINENKNFPVAVETHYSSKISDLLTSFLSEKANSRNTLESALYFGCEWHEFWNRLLINGKAKPSLESFSKTLDSKWIDRLSFEEELISSFICTKLIEPLKGETKLLAEKNNFHDVIEKFNFKSVRFDELKNLKDFQCIFKDPQSIYLNKDPETSCLNETLFLDKKWLDFLFADRQILVNKKRLDNAIAFNNGAAFFDKSIYKHVMRSMLEPFVLEANADGKKTNSYVHLILTPLGINNNSKLGEDGFNVHSEMSKIQVECYLEIIKDHNLKNISCLNFSRFKLITQRRLKVISKNYNTENQQKLQLVYATKDAKDQKNILVIGKKEIDKKFKFLRVEQTFEDETILNIPEPRRLDLEEGEQKRPEGSSEFLTHVQPPLPNSSSTLSITLEPTE